MNDKSRSGSEVHFGHERGRWRLHRWCLSGFAVWCFLGADSPEIFHRAVYTIFDGPLFRATEGRDLFDVVIGGSSAFLSQCQVSKLEPARALFR
jgi:hypothetical protein